MSWFVTETREDGTKISTECTTIEHQNADDTEDTRYHRLCRMQKALDDHQEEALAQMMAEYETLITITEERFQIL